MPFSFGLSCMGFWISNQRLAQMIFSAVLSYWVSIAAHKHRDPNNGLFTNSKKDSKKEEEIAKRLGRPGFHTTNSYEDLIACGLTNPDDIDVEFNSIGGLQTQKQTIFELTILPLKRPQLFYHGGKLLGPSKGVLLYGPPGTGKTMLAKAIAKESGAVFINVSPSTVMNRWLGESGKNMAAVFSLAYKLQPAIIFIDEVDGLLGKRQSLDHSAYTNTKNIFMALCDGLTTKKNARVMVLGATNRPSQLDEAILRRFTRAFEIGMPDLMERAEILRVTLQGERVENNIDFDHLASLTQDYSGSDLFDICKQAAYLPIRELLDDENGNPSHQDPRLLSQQDLENVIATSINTRTAAHEYSISTRGNRDDYQVQNDLKKAADQRKEISKRFGRPRIQTNSYEDVIACDVINPDHIDVEFNSIGGLESYKQEVFELLILPLKRPELFSFGKLLGPSKGILLYGPPGTGKTMLAKAIAKESGAVFINVKVSNLMNKLFGESQKLVAAVFSLAHKLQPAIIFIDEVDSLLGQRRHLEHESLTNMKTEFMALWDGFKTDKNARVMVLGATNRPSELDEAILRRFSRAFEIGMPDLKERAEILKVILRGEKIEDNIDFDHLASLSEGYSGSDLFDICKQAAYVPIKELLDDEKNGNPSHDPRPLSQQDLAKVLATSRKTRTAAHEYSRTRTAS